MAGMEGLQASIASKQAAGTAADEALKALLLQVRVTATHLLASLSKALVKWTDAIIVALPGKLGSPAAMLDPVLSIKATGDAGNAAFHCAA